MLKGICYQSGLWVLKVRDGGVHELQRWVPPQHQGSWTKFLLVIAFRPWLPSNRIFPQHESFLLAMVHQILAACQGWQFPSTVCTLTHHLYLLLLLGMLPPPSISCFVAQLQIQHLMNLGKLLGPLLAPQFPATQPMEWLFLYLSLTGLQGTQPSVCFCEGVSKRP